MNERGGVRGGGRGGSVAAEETLARRGAAGDMEEAGVITALRRIRHFRFPKECPYQGANIV